MSRNGQLAQRNDGFAEDGPTAADLFDPVALEARLQEARIRRAAALARIRKGKDGAAQAGRGTPKSPEVAPPQASRAVPATGQPRPEEPDPETATPDSAAQDTEQRGRLRPLALAGLFVSGALVGIGAVVFAPADLRQRIAGELPAGATPAAGTTTADADPARATATATGPSAISDAPRSVLAADGDVRPSVPLARPGEARMAAAGEPTALAPPPGVDGAATSLLSPSDLPMPVAAVEALQQYPLADAGPGAPGRIASTAGKTFDAPGAITSPTVDVRHAVFEAARREALPMPPVQRAPSPLASLRIAAAPDVIQAPVTPPTVSAPMAMTPPAGEAGPDADVASPTRPVAAQPPGLDLPRTADASRTPPASDAPDAGWPFEVASLMPVAAPESLPAFEEPAAVPEPQPADPGAAGDPAAPAGARIYVHYPPDAGDAAGAAVEALRQAGYADVTAMPVNFTVSGSNIRYFHAADRDSALGAAEALGAGDAGSAPDTRDFTEFRPQPEPGHVEIFLAGGASPVVARSVAPPAPTRVRASAPSAAARQADPQDVQRVLLQRAVEQMLRERNARQ